MERKEKLNLSMLFDFYEMTMANGYFRSGMQDRITYFDVFFRRVPDGGGFAIAAGLEQLVDYIRDLHFDAAPAGTGPPILEDCGGIVNSILAKSEKKLIL